jgi:hypothetical protein
MMGAGEAGSRWAGHLRRLLLPCPIRRTGWISMLRGPIAPCGILGIMGGGGLRGNPPRGALLRCLPWLAGVRVVLMCLWPELTERFGITGDCGGRVGENQRQITFVRYEVSALVASQQVVAAERASARYGRAARPNVPEAMCQSRSLVDDVFLASPAALAYQTQSCQFGMDAKIRRDERVLTRFAVGVPVRGFHAPPEVGCYQRSRRFGVF